MKENILYIEPYLPYPLDNGGNQAIFNGLKAMQDYANLYVTFMVDWRFSTKNLEDFKNSLPDIKILPFEPPKNEKKINLTERISLSLYYRNIAQKQPKEDSFKSLYTCESFPDEYLQHISKVIKEKKISAVVVEMPWMMSIVTALPDDVKKIYIHHELRFIRNQLELMSAGKNLYRESATKVSKILEVGLLNMYDAVITLSSIDKMKLENEGVVTPIYSSFAVVKYYNYKKAKDINYKNTLSFLGWGTHLPNRVGLNWFLDNCWSTILEKDPSIQLNIIGKWSENDIEALSVKYQNIHFLGFVEHLDKALQGTVMIVPITIGSGIRMKILESANLAVPFVTTTIGVEGLAFEHGKSCYIGDTPSDFVNGVFHLLPSSERERIADNARKVIKESYTFEALKTNRINIFNAILRKS